MGIMDILDLYRVRPALGIHDHLHRFLIPWTLSVATNVRIVTSAVLGRTVTGRDRVIVGSTRHLPSQLLERLPLRLRDEKRRA